MREPISKAKRFRIFSRDGFTCRYCGRQADVVPLTIDHVQPVSKGGTSEDENLLTACEACNSGKSDKLLGSIAPTEADRLKLAQERNELASAYQAAKSSAKARRNIEALVLEHWCNATGRNSTDRQSLHTVCSYVEQLGYKLVCDWITKAVLQTGGKNDKNIGQYVSGCRRRKIEEDAK